MTLKRRAEISAETFYRLLWYFLLSCKNLTITLFYYLFQISTNVVIMTKIALIAPIPKDPSHAHVIQGLKEMACTAMVSVIQCSCCMTVPYR